MLMKDLVCWCSVVKINRDSFKEIFFYTYKGKNLFPVKQTDLYFPVIDVG